MYINAKEVAEYKVHPYAMSYPMIPDEKLAALAADIGTPSNGKQTGQVHPVVVRLHKGVYELIDGRNRLAACLLAGVDVLVSIIKLDDNEVVDFIVRLNDQRRQLNSRQQAEAAWKYLETMSTVEGKKVTREQAAKRFGIALRTLHKWKPGGQAAAESDERKGNNNNHFPIFYVYRHLAFYLSELMKKSLPKHIDRKEIDHLSREIVRLYKLEFSKGSP